MADAASLAVSPYLSGDPLRLGPDAASRGEIAERVENAPIAVSACLDIAPGVGLIHSLPGEGGPVRLWWVNLPHRPRLAPGQPPVEAVVVLVNGVFSVLQEYRAERAVEALQEMFPVTITALRSGQEVRLAAAELVPGDVVQMAEGDQVPADGQLLSASELLVETLGATTVICTDRTGTITQNRMAARSVWVGGRTLAAEGPGSEGMADVRDLLEAVVLASHATVGRTGWPGGARVCRWPRRVLCISAPRP